MPDQPSDVSIPIDLDPRAVYQDRLAESQKVADRLLGREDALGNLRLGLFLAGVVLAWLAWSGSLGIGWTLAVLVGFAVLVVVHGRVAGARQTAQGRVAYHRRGLDRLDDRWAGAGVSGDQFLDEDHPYASDLDLFGPGSVFERLCQARTLEGQSCLARWLLAPASVEVIETRQEAIRELRQRLAFREDLALLGDGVRSGVTSGSLGEWGRVEQRRAALATRGLIGLVAGSAFVGVVGWLAGFWSFVPVLIPLVVEAGIAGALARRADRALAQVEERAGELSTLGAILARIEREPFAAPALRALQARLGGEGPPASERIGRLARLVLWVEARHNVYFALFSSFFLWKTQFALAVEDWRSREGASIATWLDVVGEFEALTSLASFSFENPADPFPELVGLDSGPILEGEGLGHPLLPASRAVRNDLKLGGELRVLSISGSNMSGKSTWLRTVGVNAVLAQAGGTVRARRLRLSPLTLGGTLRVHDSLQAGQSRFYAEILRLKRLVELASCSPPLFFLIDEVLHGTNSHDRLQGAEAVIRGLIERGAIGLFTTHDLALAEVAGRLTPRAENVHFADHLDDSGRLAFDYQMRPGVVHQSNALALMRTVGLEV